MTESSITVSRVCAILQRLYTSSEHLKRVYTCPRPIFGNILFQINYGSNHYLQLLQYVLVLDSERPDISGPIQSIKMYSYAQCTVQERSVCSGDVPCLAHMEQGSGPLHPEHLPPSLSAWGSGCSLSLWRVARGSKLMRLELIHGLFIT